MEEKGLIISLDLISKRIDRINELIYKKNSFDKIGEQKSYYEALKLNFIEIGEESKKINDFLLKEDGSWDDIISKQYNFRISLTHYYVEINDELMDKFLAKDFEKFVLKINELKKRFY